MIIQKDEKIDMSMIGDDHLSKLPQKRKVQI